MDTQFEKNRNLAFSEKLRSLMKDRKNDRGKPITQEELASAIFSSRSSVAKWLSGENYPSDPSLASLCEFFGVPPTFFDPEEGELIYMDEERHKELDQLCRRTADHIGLRESLVQFVKETPALADLVASVSWVHSVVNPPDSRVPDNGSAFQYVTSSGARFYLPDDVLYMLRCVQRDLEEYSAFLIRKYSPVISAHYLSSEQEKKSPDYLPPVSRFARDLEGFSALSPDESSMISIFRLLNEKDRIELVKQAAHMTHKARKK